MMRKKQAQQKQLLPQEDKRLKRILGLLRLRIQDGRWCSGDFGAQMQTLNTIMELVDLPRENFICFFQFAAEEIVIALEGLLRSSHKEVRQRAADTTLAVLSKRDRFEASFERLVPALAYLLSSSALCDTVSTSISLKLLISGCRSDHLLDAVKDHDLVRTLIMHITTVENDVKGCASSAELLAVILERLPTERFVVASKPSLITILFKHAASYNDNLVFSSFRLLSSIALCTSAAALIVRDPNLVLDVVQKKICSVKGDEALQFFFVLYHTSLLSLVRENDIGYLVERCVEAVKLEYEAFDAVNAACTLLSTPGKHHLQFIKAGFLSVLPLASDPLPLHARKRGKALRECVGLMGYFCDKVEKELLFSQHSLFGIALDNLCAAFFKAVFPEGRGYTVGHNKTQYHFSEMLGICRGMLLVVSSPCEVCSSKARRACEKLYRIDHYQRILNSLIVLEQETTKAFLIKVLYALSVLCYIPSFKMEVQMLKAVTRCIQRHRESKLVPSDGLSITNLELRSFKPCCFRGLKSWTGADDVIFASLWILALLLQDSNVSQHKDSDCFNLLLGIARERDAPQGITWLASACLATYNLFGFPSDLGECFSKLLEDSSLADVHFIFPDGRCLYAHRVLLFARCPALLANSADEKDVLDLRMSSRISYSSMKSILTYIYTGVVKLSREEIPDVRALAARCQLKPLLTLLDRSPPTREAPIHSYSLLPALQRCRFSDFTFRFPQSTNAEKCTTCNIADDHVHAHKAVLSSRCDYLEALFRSGMRDSSTSVIDAPAGKDVVLSYLRYVYADELEDPCPTVCSWQALSLEQQWRIIEHGIELAGLAEQWLHEKLKNSVIQNVLDRLKTCTPLLCPRAMELAAAKGQVEIVTASARSMARDFLKLRESGALDDLSDGLIELARQSYLEVVSQ